VHSSAQADAFSGCEFIRRKLQPNGLLSGLNEPQRLAVTHKDGPLLIFAGAGSGKTRTLTHRIAYLINEGNVPTGRILAVTFTNKAAREMRERLEGLIGPQAKRMWLGTFHALCAKMLRIHGERIGLNPRFAIFDVDDQVRLMKTILKELNIDSERFPASRVMGRISDAKNQLKSPEVVASEATKPHEKVYASLYGHYQQRLRLASALDFDDLLSEAVRLLKESPESLDHWSDRFQHVLIDEFQDVNEAQFQWAQLLASKHRNICVVGDDDQCLAAGTLVTTPDGDNENRRDKSGTIWF
jgi:DNA helicase-2/ATP-dependent DNA helicase PcrA